MYTVYCVYAFCAADAKRYVCRVYTASIIRAPARMGLHANCGVGALAEKKQEREKGKKVNKQTSQKNPPAARQASIQRVLALLKNNNNRSSPACLPAYQLIGSLLLVFLPFLPLLLPFSAILVFLYIHTYALTASRSPIHASPASLHADLLPSPPPALTRTRACVRSLYNQRLLPAPRACS